MSALCVNPAACINRTRATRCQQQEASKTQQRTCAGCFRYWSVECSAMEWPTNSMVMSSRPKALYSSYMDMRARLRPWWVAGLPASYSWQ